LDTLNKVIYSLDSNLACLKWTSFTILSLWMFTNDIPADVLHAKPC
jgi:hypothetical protein